MTHVRLKIANESRYLFQIISEFFILFLNLIFLQYSSVLWTWKDSGDEAHNVIHVNTPHSEASTH